MYVTKLKKDNSVQVGNIVFKILSTGEQSARIAIFTDNNKTPIIHKLDLEREPVKNVANL